MGAPVRVRSKAPAARTIAREHVVLRSDCPDRAVFSWSYGWGGRSERG